MIKEKSCFEEPEVTPFMPQNMLLAPSYLNNAVTLLAARVNMTHVLFGGARVGCRLCAEPWS
jgi:hypothetical protein